MSERDQRTVGLLGATGVGVGAIVGGGIMVLAGVAFENAGPGAVVAFALNGVIAFITAMSFAEISSRFPQSGGAYTFATKVLSVRAAFGVGWILWFAYIVAGVLYALGFATFAAEAIASLWRVSGGAPPAWLSSRALALAMATGATALYAISLIRKSSGGGQMATIGKVVVFVILIAVGIVAVGMQPPADSIDALSPFFARGGSGLLLAMGFTFIALQGFDLVAAIAGEVREPGRVIPRAMFLSLGCALIIYLPLLLILSVVGVEAGGSIAALAEREGDTVFATAIRHYMGETGYWLAMLAAILSTLSALHANVLAASRVAASMSRDRTLPVVLGRLHETRRTPVMAIYATALTITAILFVVPDVGAAGAAAGLIFLVSFALAHLTCFLARRRVGAVEGQYRTPWFPLIPVVGGLSCVALAIFQAVMVPSAATITGLWLGLGALLYVAVLRDHAEIHDVSAEALDPTLVKLRGKRPLVLLPIANPAHARAFIELANAIAPSEYARVLLLTVVKSSSEQAEGGASAERLANAQAVVGEALSASYALGDGPEALITTAANPWNEIARVANLHDCESLVLGLRGDVPDSAVLQSDIEDLLDQVDCDVAVIRADTDWRLARTRRILVPVGGLGGGHELRTRVLSSLHRLAPREVTFITVVPTDAAESEADRRRKVIASLPAVRVTPNRRVEVLRAEDPAEALVAACQGYDLVVVGLKSPGRGPRVFGGVSLRIARDAPCSAILLSGARSKLSGLPWW